MKDKENIITEIERRIEQLKEERSKTPSPTSETIITSLEVSLSMSSDRLSLGGRIAALEELLVFINSLSAEQPSEELEREIKLYQLRNPVINHQEKSLNGLIKRVAIYFTQWQKEKLLNKACE